MDDPVNPSHRLTPRESEIMVAITIGASGPQIAARLGISPRTVEAHRRAAITKLGAKNLVHAAVLFDRGAWNGGATL